jgi:hypothetical protein
MKPFILRFAQRFGFSQGGQGAPATAAQAPARENRVDPAPRAPAETRFTKVDRETTDDD